MVAPSDLFAFEDQDFVIPQGLHLIAGLTGFTDAGSMVRTFSEHIFENLDYRLAITFDNDELLDYRSRRPVMYFEKDHIADYEPASLAIYLVTDEVGQQFLYLDGYEPDFRWEAFADAIELIIETLGVQTLTWIHSIPFPIPHTRAFGVTVSGNRKDLINRISEWKPQTQVPGNILHLLEYRLSLTDFPTIGFVTLVPHYLSDTVVPHAAVAACEQISTATGLVIPTDQLREQGREFLKTLEENLGTNAELAKMVEGLERSFANGNTDGPMKFERVDPAVPTADEIAAELEDYLSIKRKNDDEV
ncbi:MAG: proteasome assembly chaperone family protein [Micrococcales bacterium]